MNDRHDKPYLFTLLFVGTIALSACLWWVSGLTAGPEYGGRYDVPAVHGGAWFGFLASVPVVLVTGGHWMTRMDDWVDSRRRRRHAGKE